MGQWQKKREDGPLWQMRYRMAANNMMAKGLVRVAACACAHRAWACRLASAVGAREGGECPKRHGLLRVERGEVGLGSLLSV